MQNCKNIFNSLKNKNIVFPNNIKNSYLVYISKNNNINNYNNKFSNNNNYLKNINNMNNNLNNFHNMNNNNLNKLLFFDIYTK